MVDIGFFYLTRRKKQKEKKEKRASYQNVVWLTSQRLTGI